MANGKAGAPKGNTNAARAKIWSDAIRKNVLMGGNLDKLAQALILAALGGDVSAMREIGDRLEGKCAQPLVGADEGPVSIEFTWRAPS